MPQNRRGGGVPTRRAGRVFRASGMKATTMTTAQTNPLLGSWQLVRWDIRYSDGRSATLPYGEDATGLIVYATDGWMSACIARAGRPVLSSDSVRHAPQGERLDAFDSYFAYAGRYTLREHDGRAQVVHDVTMSLNPNFVGTRQVRDMAFDDAGRLSLSASDTLPRSALARQHRLLWQRG
jgi:hypothetical protein